MNALLLTESEAYRCVIILPLLAVLLCGTACEETTVKPNAPACEGVPYIEGSGPVFPGVFCTNGKVSCDGSTLAYLIGEGSGHTRIMLVDLQTGFHEQFGITNLPDSIVATSFLSLEWCPYDPNVIGVDAITYSDTTGHGRYNIEGRHSFICNKNGKLIRVTGAFRGNVLRGQGFTGTWLVGSSPEADSLSVGNHIYIPQENKKIESGKQVLAQSRDGKHWYGRIHAYDQFEVHKLDGYPLYFDGMEYDFWRVSFSPSGKYLAVMGVGSDVLPPEIRPPDYKPNVFILDIETWLRDPSQNAPVVLAINFQQAYCKFTIESFPVFITDSTFAVSMFGAYDIYSNYYEVGIDGTLIRQLSQPL